MKTSHEEADLCAWFIAGLEGDERAYQAFLLSVSGLVRAVIRAKAGGLSAEEREDILQEVLLAIHKKRASWRRDHPVKPWVYAISRYKIIDVFRARGRAMMVDISDFQDEVLAVEPDEAIGMDIGALVDQLPAKQAQVVRLIAIDELSIKECAQKLGMKEGAVRVNFHRGLERLRQQGSEA